MRVLFVCLGNICRSPAAEGLARSIHPDWQVDSAGTASWHVGKAPYGPMQDAAAARDLDLSDLRARTITPGDFQRFDRVYAMDASVLADLQAMPGGQMAQMFTDEDVPDPYYTRDFEGCLDMIEDALRRAPNP